MNIEELFNNELWLGYGLLTTDDANCAINYLKEEVMEYVAGLEKRIAELEAQVDSLQRDLISIYQSVGNDLAVYQLKKLRGEA